jgi:hypothetical protein
MPEFVVASAPDVERAAAPEDVDEERVEDEELEDVTDGNRGSECVDVWVMVTGGPVDPRLSVGVWVIMVTGAGATEVMADVVGGVVDGDAATTSTEVEPEGDRVVIGAVENDTTVDWLLSVTVDGGTLKGEDVEVVVMPGKGPVMDFSRCTRTEEQQVDLWNCLEQPW